VNYISYIFTIDFKTPEFDVCF